MGKGKKKKGPRQGSPSSSSPPQSSSPPSNSRSKVNGSSAVPENSIETLNPPSSAFEHASDAQIVDLAAQQVQADMEKEASLPDSPKLASEALTGDSCPDLVAQQTDSISTQKSPSTKTLNLASDAQIIDSSSDLAAQLDGETRLNESDSTTNNLEPVTATDSAAPGTKSADAELSEKALPATHHQLGPLPEPNTEEIDTWCTRAKGRKLLKKRSDGFTLPSGEACVKIPNSVIEKNKRSWDCFVIGQFYTDPPSQGTIHNIVNGIWSKQYRDIAVSKLEGNAFLFKIPNVSTRNRVITQVLWQIEGKTMFVAKWEPGVIPAKPELKSAPIWLELRKVPFQFFNEDGIERIASLVGDPKFLHPATENKTNLEVAKVFTLIDPREPLPEAVNVQFDSGDICRVLVSSPWMPPVCDYCKEIGHNVKGCSKSPKLCNNCSSKSHGTINCPNNKKRDETGPGKKTRRGKSKSKSRRVSTAPKDPQQGTIQIYRPIEKAKEALKDNQGVFEVGGTSGSSQQVDSVKRIGFLSRASSATCSDVEHDSSDVDSSDSDKEEGEILEYDTKTTPKLKNRHTGRNHAGGKTPSHL